jgi:hypothetical protein
MNTPIGGQTAQLRDAHVETMDLTWNTLETDSSKVVFLNTNESRRSRKLEPNLWDYFDFMRGHATNFAKEKADLLSVIARDLSHTFGPNGDDLADPFAANDVLANAPPVGMRRSSLDGPSFSMFNSRAVGDAQWAESDPFNWLAHRKQKRMR